MKVICTEMSNNILTAIMRENERYFIPSGVNVIDDSMLMFDVNECIGMDINVNVTVFDPARIDRKVLIVEYCQYFFTSANSEIS